MPEVNTSAWSANSNPCNDSDPCSNNDTCESGICTGTITCDATCGISNCNPFANN